MPTTTQQRAVYNRQPANRYDFRVSFFNPTIWLDEFSDFFQDSAGTIPADAVGEVVGRWSDRSGNGFHATSSLTNRPVLASSGGALIPDFDGSDDHLVIANDAAFAELEAWTVAIRVAADDPGSDDAFFWLYEGVSYGAWLNNGIDGLQMTVDGDSSNASTTIASGLSEGADTWLFMTFDNDDDRKGRFWTPSQLDATVQTAMSGDLVLPSNDLYLGNGSAGGTVAPYGGLYRAFIVFPGILTPQNMRWIMNGAA